MPSDRHATVLGGASWHVPADLPSAFLDEARHLAADLAGDLKPSEIVDELVARYGGRNVTAPPARPSLDAYLLAVAEVVASRSTCSRLSVGAVLARDGRILSTGYNGAPRGLPHCDGPHEGPCATAVHAEANALIQAARHGTATEGATMYATHAPCAGCAGLIVNAGIVRVAYAASFRSADGLARLAEAGVQVGPAR